MEADGFNIFLASPSDLDEYRRAARDQFEHVRRMIAGPRRIDFDPVGWEDISPGFGRPQGVINPKLDECNVLIGILGKQLGTPTGEAESGFVEEYERMATRAREGEDVAIWIYTLQLTPEDRADPGDKLKAVLTFRERLYKEALVKEFRSVDDFAAQLFRDLVALLLDVDERRRGRSEGVAPTVAEETRPEPEREPSDEAQRQLQGLLSEAAKEAPFAPERFRDERLPLARLGLWLSTWDSWYFTNDTIDVHLLNRIYVVREQTTLSTLEARHVLRSMCAQPQVAPGWALLDYDDDTAPPELLALASGTEEADAVRIGALEMLEPAPLDAWIARADVDIDRPRIFEALHAQIDGTSDSVRNAITNFAERMGGEDGIEFLVELADRDPTRRQATQALIRLYARESSSQVFDLTASAEEIDDRTLAAVRTAAADAELTELEQLAGGLDERLRMIAIQLLAARGKDAVPVLVARLDDPADDVALAAFSVLCESGDPAINLSEAYDKLLKREGLKFDNDLRRAINGTRDVQQLRESIDWLNPQTASAYQVLAENHWEDFCDIARRDLSDGFDTFAEESRSRLRDNFSSEVVEAIEGGGENLVTESGTTLTPVDPKIVKQFRDFLAGSDWNTRQFALAALAGIAKNGETSDASLVRPWLDSGDREVREAAAEALARTGSDDDLSKLLELSQKRGGDAFASAALSLSPGPSGAATALLDSQRATAILGARHLYLHADEISSEVLELLLHHSTEEVRRIGVACALTTCSDDALKDLLDRYVSADSYYYTVVFWLDRALFAPSCFRERTRSELLGFAAEDRSAELPGASSRSALSLFDRFMRWNN